MKFEHTARTLIATAFAAILMPAAEISPSEWGAQNIVVPDGPRAGQKFDPRLTPYVVEPLDNMGPASPVNIQFIEKSAQTGFSLMAQIGTGHSIDCDPSGGFLLVQPTQDALDKFLRDKFNPMVEGSPALAAKIAPQVARSGEGSTAYNKRYPGGSLALVIANSAAALRSMTKKRVVKDEASEYPDDLEGQGSPHSMIEARRTAFLASADWKETNISTPTIKGACYISEGFGRSDKRYWHIDCPGCATPFHFRFGRDFRFNESYPFEAHYVAPCCGTVIEAVQKNALVRAGSKRANPHPYLERIGLRNGWIATEPGPGKPPGYHFDAMSSPFVPWDYIAEKWIEAQGDPAKLKTFYNLVLGEAYEIKGNAPDHVRLMERREDYRQGHIPPRGLMLVAAADVQMGGIYVEVVAYAPDRQSWVVDAHVLAGDTTDHKSGAFALLDEVYRREYPDAFGGRRSVDGFCVDSGFRSHVVYAWCRERHKAYATKGFDGWSRPALGTPKLQDIDLNGRKITQGVALWPVGTWPLKGHWYEDLHREGMSAGKDRDPPGFCHFGKFLDEIYFRQITSEYLAETRHRGVVAKAWKQRGKEENHFLDCRIMNMALADHLGLSRMTEDEWKILARERAGALLDQGNLFAPRPLAVSAQMLANASRAAGEPGASDPAQTESAAPVPGDTTDDNPRPDDARAPVPDNPAPADRQDSAGSSWIGRDTGGWLKR